MKRGRPTVRTPKVDRQILDAISSGKPLAQICREIGIDRTIVYDWRKEDSAFDQLFAHARDVGFDAIAEECLAIADEEPEFAVTEQGRRRDTGYVAWQKSRVETRLKLLAKWDPKRYGDKQQVEMDAQHTHSVEPAGLSEVLGWLEKASGGSGKKSG